MESGIGSRDILRDAGYLGMGSRLKRLSDRLLVDASAAHGEEGQGLQPGQFPLMAALDRFGSMTVNEAAQAIGVSQPAVTRVVSELVKADFVSSKPGVEDKRQRRLALTSEGHAALLKLKSGLWPRVEAAAREVFSNLEGDFLEQLSAVEARLAEAPLIHRIRARRPEILRFEDGLAPAFHDINVEWIESMFELEAHDRHVLENPRQMIVEPGGEVLFLRLPDVGIVGTCALMPDRDGFTELTKMGVLEAARGRKAGEQLLVAALELAGRRGFTEKLYLVTNRKCGPAIHLYEKLGFVHDQEVMERFGRRYERCDVAMRYRPRAASRITAATVGGLT